MAKDDYDVIAYKILVYLYACMKGKAVFNKEVFHKAIKAEISDDYLTKILKLMKDEELISGAVITKAWGGAYILSSEISDLEITAKGIRYLNENDPIRKLIISGGGIVAGLIEKIL